MISDYNIINDTVICLFSEQNKPPASPETPKSQEPDQKHDDEFSSLTLDIDNSIHQLNQLILDLDPTFEPISTKSSSLKRAGAPDRNGVVQKDGGGERSQRMGKITLMSFGSDQ